MVMTVPDALAKKILETWQAIGHARSGIEHGEYGMADELLKTLEGELITIHGQYELDAIPGTHEDD